MLRSLDGHCASLLGCSLSSCYWSSPELKTSCANPWLPSHLEPLHLEIGQQSLPGAQAESSWYPSSCGTPLQERITEADWIAALEASLFWNHYLGQKNTTSSLKNNKTIWEKFISCARTFTCCERKAWCFTCIWVSHLFLTVNNNIYHGQFWHKEVFFWDTLYLIHIADLWQTFWVILVNG